MYDTILVPTDGSDHAVRAAEHGFYLGRAFDATVHVVNVVDVKSAGGLFDAGGVDEAFLERLEARGEEDIDAVEAVAGEGDDLVAAVVRGEPRDAILEYADEHDADLLAMGTHGRTGVSRYVAGSVTEGTVRLAGVPVLTASATDRSRMAGDYDDVLIPTDGSEFAAEAVDHGIAIAEKAGARVHAVYVVDVGALATSPGYTPPGQVIEHLESEGERATNAVASWAREAGLEATTHVREGYPARELLDYADEQDVDLISMGTAGRTGLSRYLLGSTTERVIRHADVPVLVVNARERGED